MLDRNVAKEILKSHEPDFLVKAKNSGYVCPRCGNGEGKNGTGITLDRKSGRWHCFKCDLHEDSIGLWKIFKNLSDDAEVFRTMSEHYYLQVEGNQPKASQKPAKNPHIEKYVKECSKRAAQTDYFTKRGISKELIEMYNLGYDPNFKTSKGMWRAAIIPTGAESYVARNTAEGVPDDERYRKTGSINIYLRENLESEDPVFITEGEIDALSIMETGALAVGLGSISNWKKLIEILRANPRKAPLIIALDNDPAGEETAEKLAVALDELHIPHYKYDPYIGAKDANAALNHNKAAFMDRIGEVIAQVEAETAALLEAQRALYYETSAAGHIDDFLNSIHKVDTPCIPVGFSILNSLLEGGLYEGLYILGAVSSAGKTTFALQLADQIAEKGNSVLFFSMEMARYELMAKSISRHTMRGCGSNMTLPKTVRQILNRRRYEYFSDAEKQLIFSSINEYQKYAKDIFIHEGIGDITVEKVREEVEKHIRHTGQKPVVFIDYVQILAPHDPRATDKQNIDKAVVELKRMSRDFKIPVIGISSFNRANYKTSLSMEAFKESGALEYGADVLMGLQLTGTGSKDFDRKAALAQNPRNVELEILKNRNGDRGTIFFDYYPLFNNFIQRGGRSPNGGTLTPMV